MEEQLMNMSDTFISFETAKLGKEKGFDWETLNFYTKPNSKMFGIDEHDRVYNIKNISKKLYTCGQHAALNEKSVYLAPTQSLLQKWLRETHQLHPEIQVQDYVETPKFYWNIFGAYKDNKMIRCIANSPKEDYVSYEEALEAGLLAALKLI